MPHRVVVHVHSVNTIARAVRRDGPSHLAGLLDGLSWQWIPYVSSGLPLALQTQRVTSSSPDVLVLANHGLVIGAESFGAAEALLEDVENRLAAVPRTGSEPQWSHLERMAANAPCWRVPDIREVHALATDAKSRAILMGGILYPCQAVLLGTTTAVIPPDTCLAESEHCYQARYGVSPNFFLVEGSGVLVKKNMTVAQAEVLLGLSHVVQRIEANAPIRYLTSADLEDLLAADVHHYRYEESRFKDLQKPPLQNGTESARAELL
jgi:rhamnose utilization protein RhaD (predicted bifunctional aldolase and dehydrogenase)